MPSSVELYPLVFAWMQALPAATPVHPAALSALAHLVTALLIGQSLRPSALMRALLSPLPVPARQRDKRVARLGTAVALARLAGAAADPGGAGPGPCGSGRADPCRAG